VTASSACNAVIESNPAKAKIFHEEFMQGEMV
jgi:hypothetical protein